MRNNIFLILILLLLLLNSCGKCVETNLTDEEKKWFSIYEKGQTIIFKSNEGNLDTLFVSEKKEGHGNENCNYYGIGPIQPNIMYIILKLKNCKSEWNCDVGISVSKDQVDKKCFPGFYAFGLYQEGNLKNEDSKLENFKISTTDKRFNDVYKFEDGVNAKNSSLTFIKSFHWDKKEGLIRYDTSEGEIFELLSKK